MPIFDDEQRKRLFLTPGLNPNLPDPAAPSMRPLPASGAPGNLPRPNVPSPSALPEAVMGNPTLSSPARMPGVIPPNPLSPELSNAATLPQSRSNQLSEAENVYLQGTPGRGKSALLGAVGGALRGLGSGQGLGGAIGGAIAGGAFGGINPRGAREQQFNELVKPKILEGFAAEDAGRAQQLAAQKGLREDQLAQANIANIGSQIQSRQAGDVLNRQKANYEQNRPFVVPQGGAVMRPGQAQPVFTNPREPKPPSAAELGVDPDDGMSVEEKARASYENRGGDGYVYNRLSERTRQVLEDEAGKYGPAEVAAAQREYESAKNRQWQSDLSYTKGAIRAKVLRGRPSSSGGGGGSARPAGNRNRTAISVQEAADLLK